MSHEEKHSFVPYGKQTLTDQDRKAVYDALASDWITSGPKVTEFENKVCAYTGAKFGVAVNSGTAALDVAIRALELPEGSEIITTPFTWISTVNSILFNKMVPVLADICPKTYNLSVESVRAKISDKTKAILFIDYAGQPADIEGFRSLADEFGLFLIEDAAQSFSAWYQGKRVGSLAADMTTFSFHPVKHITTGEGGMVVTQSEKFIERLKMLRNHGVTKSFKDRLVGTPSYTYDVKYLSKNYRISDFQCALGISQLSRSDEFLEAREKIAFRYTTAFGSQSLITVPFVAQGSRSAWHIYPILLDISIDRDVFFKKMREKNVGVNVHHIPAYQFSYHKSKFDWKAIDYPVCHDVFLRTVTLPIFPLLSSEDQQYVIYSVIEVLKEMKGEMQMNTVSNINNTNYSNIVETKPKLRMWALIPARGGSKRIPRKNVIDFVGKPMLQYSIDAAKQSGLFERVIVSTEDAEIAAVARQHCEVDLRDPTLATDAATLKDVCAEFVRRHQGQVDVICLMEADCPMRDAKALQVGARAFLEGKHSMLMSVFSYGTFYPFWALANKTLEGENLPGYQFFFSKKYLVKSQQLPKVYCPSGAFKFFQVSRFLETPSMYPDDLDVCELPWYKALDIDTYKDLIMGKMMQLFLNQHGEDFFEREEKQFLEYRDNMLASGNLTERK